MQEIGGSWRRPRFVSRRLSNSESVYRYDPLKICDKNNVGYPVDAKNNNQRWNYGRTHLQAKRIQT